MLLQRRKISWREKAGDPQFDGKAKIVWQTREELIEFLCKRLLLCQRTFGVPHRTQR